MTYRTLPFLLSLCSFLFIPNAGSEETPRKGVVAVENFGAKGDGTTDDTGAFQAALDAVAATGGGVVIAPSGKFLIQGHLTIPKNVTLEGVWRAPQAGQPLDAGTTLLAVEGKGDAEGTPFITLNTGSTLSGVTIFHPEQIIADPPHPYPWTIRSGVLGAKGQGSIDNPAILNVTLINPYQAVDFGSVPTGRHKIDGLHAHALKRGLYIDQCYDVGRIRNVHFWPFFDLNPESPLWKFTKREGTSFIIGRTDGEMATDCFSIFYRVGMHFINGIGGPGSGVYTNCYLDVSPCAVRVDEVASDSGISFVNGMLMSGVEVSPSNTGQVKFTGCGLWATAEVKSHALLEGLGAVFFESCHFTNWDRPGQEFPCIDANNRRLIVTGCEFGADRGGQVAVRLGRGVRSAVVTANLVPGGDWLKDETSPAADVQVGLNSSEGREGLLREWLVLGGFPNPKVDSPAPGRHTRAGIDVDYLTPLGGEGDARVVVGATIDFRDESGLPRTVTPEAGRMNSRQRLDFTRLREDKKKVAYAYTEIESASRQTASFFFGSNDSAKVWVNGRLVHEIWTEAGRTCLFGNDFFEATLEQGVNRILVKVEDGGGHAWEFALEGFDHEGKPLSTAERFTSRKR